MKTIKERCPFREGSASFKLFMALAKSKQPLTAIDASKLAKIPLAKCETLLRAYRNPFHCAPLARSGVELTLKDGKFGLKFCKANPKARRPERGRKIRRQKKQMHRKPDVKHTEPTPLPAATTLPDVNERK